METVNDREAVPVIRFENRPILLLHEGGGLERRPYVALYENDGDYISNPDNFPKGDVLRVRRKA